MIITLNKVLYAINKALGDTYPDAKVYDNEIPQNLNPPSFYVKLLTSEQTQELGRRHMRYHTFDIHYFSPGYRNNDMHNVTDMLYEKLLWLNIEDHTIRGTAMRHEIVDRVLHFFVDYNCMVWLAEPVGEPMQTLHQQGGIKG